MRFCNKWLSVLFQLHWQVVWGKPVMSRASWRLAFVRLQGAGSTFTSASPFIVTGLVADIIHDCEQAFTVRWNHLYNCQYQPYDPLHNLSSSDFNRKPSAPTLAIVCKWASSGWVVANIISKKYQVHKDTHALGCNIFLLLTGNKISS